MEPDKLIEIARYDARAVAQMSQSALATESLLGSCAMAAYLREPYQYYESSIAGLLSPGCKVLELGSGTGAHTRALLQTGAQVMASDISPNSLSLLRQRLSSTYENLMTATADIENLPFDVNSFDVIACAGSLSYGDPKMVDSEIRRVLRPGGSLICVDSLNHNPIYRFNRWMHYLRGNRSKTTLKRMPDLNRIKALGFGFSDVHVEYFGSLTFAMPMVASLVGDNIAQTVSDQFDRWIDVRRSAFKFVLVAQRLS
jgi:ubiquinone/menaquinone biosynthesis C-methylase UbiE